MKRKVKIRKKRKKSSSLPIFAVIVLIAAAVVVTLIATGSLPGLLFGGTYYSQGNILIKSIQFRGGKAYITATGGVRGQGLKYEVDGKTVRIFQPPLGAIEFAIVDLKTITGKSLGYDGSFKKR